MTITCYNGEHDNKQEHKGKHNDKPRNRKRLDKRNTGRVSEAPCGMRNGKDREQRPVRQGSQADVQVLSDCHAAYHEHLSRGHLQELRLYLATGFKWLENCRG